MGVEIPKKFDSDNFQKVVRHYPHVNFSVTVMTFNQNQNILLEYMHKINNQDIKKRFYL